MVSCTYTVLNVFKILGIVKFQMCKGESCFNYTKQQDPVKKISFKLKTFKTSLKKNDRVKNI